MPSEDKFIESLTELVRLHKQNMIEEFLDDLKWLNPDGLHLLIKKWEVRCEKE